ncbi:MAG: outer membrane lipoprotein SlyB [Candidatus Azotimanducaceae bacterium]|jgi:outer membrane lipoprotein SlyB
MTSTLKNLSLTVALTFTFGLTGCSTTEYVQANVTPAKQAQYELPVHLYMDIGIIPFDANIPSTDEELAKQLLNPDVRRAETQFLAYHLKDTMEQTGNWGAVRVTPTPSEAVDLHVTGRIENSDGELLIVSVTTTDATGKVWLTKEYKDQASKFSYEKDVRDDPFQDLYNEIANDILTYRESLDDTKIKSIRQVASLKYAESLAPDAFSKYLDNSGSVTQITQLPADSDRMLNRVERIKEREFLFVDTLDEFYGQFYRDMKPSYREWRYATYGEAIKLRQLDRKARNRLIGGAALIVGGLYAGAESSNYASQAASTGAVLGGIQSIKSGLNVRKDAEIHAESLKELSASLGAEITPFVLDIEGKTIELEGTATVQYDEWRRILKDIYAAETTTPVQN